MQVVSLINIAIANKDAGEVCYKTKTILYLALVKVGFNRDNCYTIKYYLKVS